MLLWRVKYVILHQLVSQEFCEQTEPLKEEFVLKERTPSGFVF